MAVLSNTSWPERAALELFVLVPRVLLALHLPSSGQLTAQPQPADASVLCCDTQVDVIPLRLLAYGFPLSLGSFCAR